jgi:hypothetical protein
METGLRSVAVGKMVEFMRLAALAVFAAAATLSGCAAVSTGQGDGGRAQLVNDLAGRLERSSNLTYTAVYRLPLGVSVTISQAQNPSRAAYVYPGGKITLTPQQLADCRSDGAGTTCTLTPPPSPGTDPATTLLGTVADRGLIAPQTVTGLLTATALDPNAMVTTHDTTVAGENATCVHVSGVQRAAATQFEVCVTTDGLLGSFTGQVGSSQVDASLDHYDQVVAVDAFDLPAGAHIVDHRPK